MSKSKESPPLPGPLLHAEAGHVVIPYVVDLPLGCRYNEETGELVLDCPNLQIGNLQKAGILRLKFSPEAAHSLLRALREIEKSLGIKIEARSKQSVQ